MTGGHFFIHYFLSRLLAHDSDPDLNDPVEEPKGHTLNDPSVTSAEQGDSTQTEDTAGLSCLKM